MNALLTTSADDIPDFQSSGMTVGISDNFQNLLEEMPASEAYDMGIGVGILGGILIGIILCLILVLIVYYFQNSEKTEELKEESPVLEERKENRVTKYIVFLLIISLIFGTIIGMLYVDTYFKKDYEVSSTNNSQESNTSNTKTRKATTNDLFISVSDMTLSVQSREEIEGLIIKVNYLDKDKNILKSDEINIGKIVPGNNFQYKLTKTGMHVSDVDKLKTFNFVVLEGTIEEE